MTLLTVFIAATCYYYFGAIGALLGASVVLASLSKPKADILFPSIILIGLCAGAGALVDDGAGALVGGILATGLALWLEAGAKFTFPHRRRRQEPRRDSATT